MGKISILIIDDCEVSRKGLSKLLNEEPHFSIFGEYQFAKEAIEVLKENKIDVIIMDVNLTDMDEREVVEKIKSINPEIGIIIFSVEMDVDYLVGLAKAGVSSILKNTAPLKELVKTIKIIFRGQSYFSQKISAILSKHLVQNSADQIPGYNQNTIVTPREYQILKLIVDGYTNKEIGKQLFISPRTVDTHRRNLLLKLDVKKTAGLVKYYYSINSREGQILGSAK